LAVWPAIEPEAPKLSTLFAADCPLFEGGGWVFRPGIGPARCVRSDNGLRRRARLHNFLQFQSDGAHGSALEGDALRSGMVNPARPRSIHGFSGPGFYVNGVSKSEFRATRIWPVAALLSANFTSRHGAILSRLGAAS